MSTLIKRLSQNGSSFVPITLSEAVVVNTTNTLLQSLEVTTLDKVLRAILGLTGGNISDIQKLNEAVNQINSTLENKQNKLTAGTGIQISDTGVISLTANTTLYKIVDHLPTNPTDTCIYLVPSSNVNGNSFKEFIYIKSGENYRWEEIGTIQTDIDLSGYVTNETLNQKIGEINVNLIKAESVTTSSGSIVQVTYDIPSDLYDSAISSADDFI